jgi:putative transposase
MPAIDVRLRYDSLTTMPRLNPAAIGLEELERKTLEAIVQRHSSPQQLAQRARIILKAGTGANNRATGL